MQREVGVQLPSISTRCRAMKDRAYLSSGVGKQRRRTTTRCNAFQD